jgi:hypothetical protein
MRSRVKIPVDGQDEEEEKGSEPVAKPAQAPTPAPTPAPAWTPAPGFMDQMPMPTTQSPEHVKASIDQLSNMDDNQMEQMVN